MQQLNCLTMLVLILNIKRQATINSLMKTFYLKLKMYTHINIIIIIGYNSRRIKKEIRRIKERIRT
jgi:hypothetical protein